MTIFRILASTITVIGICMLILVIADWHNGDLAGRYFSDVEHTSSHHLQGLLLALPIPLHVIFIGLIIQKQWLTPPWARFAWVGIVSSGLWLGASMVLGML